MCACFGMTVTCLYSFSIGVRYTCLIKHLCGILHASFICHDQSLHIMLYNDVFSSLSSVRALLVLVQLRFHHR